MTESVLNAAPSSENPIVFNLAPFLNYPIQLIVQSWHSHRPLSWQSQNNEGVVAEGKFLEAPGLPLFTLADEEGRRISDDVPDSILVIAGLMPAMDFELAQACAMSQTACELAESAPLLFILLVNYARQQPLSIEEFENLLTLKRTVILERVGLPASKSLVRLV